MYPDPDRQRHRQCQLGSLRNRDGDAEDDVD